MFISRLSVLINSAAILAEWVVAASVSQCVTNGWCGRSSRFTTPSCRINCRNCMLLSHAIKGGGKSKQKNGKSEKKFTISVGIPSSQTRATHIFLPSLSDEVKTVSQTTQHGLFVQVLKQ